MAPKRNKVKSNSGKTEIKTRISKPSSSILTRSVLKCENQSASLNKKHKIIQAKVTVDLEKINIEGNISDSQIEKEISKSNSRILTDPYNVVLNKKKFSDSVARKSETEESETQENETQEGTEKKTSLFQ